MHYRRLTDPTEADRIEAALIAGAAIRVVAAAEHRSTRTIWKLRRRLAEAGQLAPSRVGRPATVQ
jgi:hypothetical protein